jgi:hypothetical protein
MMIIIVKLPLIPSIPTQAIGSALVLQSLWGSQLVLYCQL